MATTTGKKVNPSLTGSQGDVKYREVDMAAIAAQPNVVCVAPVNIILRSSFMGVAPQSVTAFVGVAGNDYLTGDSHLFALPCPPYCEKGEG